MSKKTVSYNLKQRHYMAAVVLGTALTALGATPAEAAQFTDPGARAVNNVSRYCTACWRNAQLPMDTWQDCTQDVLIRLIQRLNPRSWELVFKAETYERQEFLRAIDAVKKRTQRHLKKTVFVNGVVPDNDSGKARHQLDEREAVQKAAHELLTPRQQNILKLSMEGWSVQEIAGELEMGPERVSDEKYKAVRKLREHFQVG
jgi:RNA polymerase sigma factor (sigma-70 family)